MSNLLAKRYNNNKIKVQANATKGKLLSGRYKVIKKQESLKPIEEQPVNVIKEVKTLPLYF